MKINFHSHYYFLLHFPSPLFEEERGVRGAFVFVKNDERGRGKREEVSHAIM
jgi:hypothetical protein